MILGCVYSNSMPDDKSKELFEKAEQALSEFLNYIKLKYEEENK